MFTEYTQGQFQHDLFLRIILEYDIVFLFKFKLWVLLPEKLLFKTQLLTLHISNLNLNVLLAFHEKTWQNIVPLIKAIRPSIVKLDITIEFGCAQNYSENYECVTYFQTACSRDSSIIKYHQKWIQTISFKREGYQSEITKESKKVRDNQNEVIRLCQMISK